MQEYIRKLGECFVFNGEPNAGWIVIRYVHFKGDSLKGDFQYGYARGGNFRRHIWGDYKPSVHDENLLVDPSCLPGGERHLGAQWSDVVKTLKLSADCTNPFRDVVLDRAGDKEGD